MQKRPFSTGVNYPLASSRGARPRYAPAPAPTAAPKQPQYQPQQQVQQPPQQPPQQQVQQPPQQQTQQPAPPPLPCANGFPHTVHAGETLALIAQRFGITLEALLTANPQITDPNLIVPDQLICVPLAPPPACTVGSLYTVQPGDTMFLIAERLGVTMEALSSANPQVTDPNLIFPGQQVCVPAPAKPQ